MQGGQRQNQKNKIDGDLRLKVAKICAAVNFTIFALVIILFISSKKLTTTNAPQEPLVSSSDKQATVNTPQESQISSGESTIDSNIHQLLVPEKIKPTEIISSKDISVATRTRRYTYIFSSEVSNDEELLATAADAAMQIQKEMEVQYSSVVLFDSPNREITYVAVDFAPDRKGANGDKDSGSRFNVTWYNKLSR